MLYLAPKWVRLTENGTNPGFLNTLFQYILSCRVRTTKHPNVSHLILSASFTHSLPSLRSPTLIINICLTELLMKFVHSVSPSYVIELDLLFVNITLVIGPRIRCFVLTHSCQISAKRRPSEQKYDEREGQLKFHIWPIICQC